VRPVLLSTGADIDVRPLSNPVQLAPTDYVQAPLPYAFARVREREYLLPTTDQDITTFNRELIQGYELLYDSPQHAVQMLASARIIAQDLASASSDPRVNAGEQEIADKLSIQRRYPPKFFVGDHNPGKGKVTPLFRECVDIYVARIAALAGDMRKADPIMLMAMDSDPSDTVQGFPTFSSEPGKRLIVARALGLRRWPTLKEFLAASTEMTTDLAFDPWMLWPSAISKRSGPLVKYTELWEDDMVSTGCIAKLEAKGLFCRARKVYMAPFLLNMMISPLAVAMKKGRLQLPGSDHSLLGQKAYLKWFDKERDGWAVAESDISGYDTSITPEVRAVLWDALVKHGFNKTSIDILRWLDDNSVILTAPWNRRMEGSMAVYTGRTGLLSGLKITAEVGSAISQAITMAALVDQGVTSLASMRAEHPQFLCLGDDILLLTRAKLDPDKFAASFESIGLKAKYLEGRRFLMRHINAQGGFGVANRVIQQSMFNEDKYVHPGQIMLGLAARLDRPSLPEHRDGVMRWLYLMADTNLGSLYSKVAVLPLDRIPGVLMAQPEVQAFIRSKIGQQWLVKLADFASHSLSSRQTLDLVEKYGLTVDQTSEREFRRALIRNLFSQEATGTTQARRDLYKTIWI